MAINTPIATGSFTIVDFNDINISTAKPQNPAIDQLWLDTSINPNILKRWNGNSWVNVDSPIYSMEINSTNGLIFKKSDTSKNTTLSAVVYKNGINITSSILNNTEGLKLIWTRKSNNAVKDEEWNLNHSESSIYVNVTTEDVICNSSFTCTLKQSVQ